MFGMIALLMIFAILAAPFCALAEDAESSAEVSENLSGGYHVEEASGGEKVFQIIFIAVMLFSLIGLPLYYYLEKRKKHIAGELSQKGDDPEDNGEESDTNTDEAEENSGNVGPAYTENEDGEKTDE